jgi:hypothetical protein
MEAYRHQYNYQIKQTTIIAIFYFKMINQSFMNKIKRETRNRKRLSVL